MLGACGRRGPQACVREARALQLNARSVRGTGEIMGRPPADVMVLVGSGAVENAWSPIYRALREFGCDAQSPDEANSILANLVQNRRYFCQAQAYLRNRDHKEIVAPKPAVEELDRKYPEICAAIRRQIELSHNNQELHLRPEFRDVWNAVVSYATRLCVMTTNWTGPCPKKWHDGGVVRTTRQ